MKRTTCVLTMSLVALLANSAAAHYLWLAATTEGDEQKANLYFEEAPHPGDGGYLDPFVMRGQLWLRSPEKPQPQALKMAEVKQPGKRWLAAGFVADEPYALESYGKWGVYRYNQTDVLLHYQARYVDVDSAAQLKQIAKADHLKLDLVPALEGDKLQVQAFFNGKPAPNRQLYVRGPGGFKLNTRLDDEGRATVEWKQPGQYFMRTYVDEADKSGTDDGKEYSLVRHHVSLTLDLPISGNK